MTLHNLEASRLPTGNILDRVPLRIELYKTVRGRAPYDDWLNSLDSRNQKSVARRLRSLKEFDHLGDTRSLQGGLYELRFLGLGLRIYFARLDQNVILILGGSDKSSQKTAMRTARVRLNDFHKRKA